ncbi:MAG: 50S ribosomal protein L4, partial [Candidatus Thioglobus sp.]
TKKTTKVTLKKEIFEVKVNEPLMTQAVKVYLSNQRQAPAKTKSRGEVKVTKKKVWRQKGTGRARHGSRNAPIFVGGANLKMDWNGCYGLLLTYFFDGIMNGC